MITLRLSSGSVITRTRSVQREVFPLTFGSRPTTTANALRRNADHQWCTNTGPRLYHVTLRPSSRRYTTVTRSATTVPQRYHSRGGSFSASTYWQQAPVALGSVLASSVLFPPLVVGTTSCEHAIASYPSKRVSRTTDDTAETVATINISSFGGFLQRTRTTLRRAIRLLLRFLKLSLVLTPVTLFYPLLLLRQNKNHHGRDAQNVVLEHDQDQPVTGVVGWYLRLCLQCVECSGAAIIKLMQWAGSRPDLFGHDFCSVFAQLQDQTTPHSWNHTVQLMRQSFGDDWHRRIKLHEVLGSGCIGQVYRGQVLDAASDNNDTPFRQVAVKVLHPNVEADIDADLDLMRLAVRMAAWMPFDTFSGLKWLNMEGIVEEFATMLKLQLDLRNEAANLQRFNENFQNDQAVEFPKLIPGYAPSKSVLVESFCDGVPVLQFAREHAHNREMLHNLCLTAIHAVCKMIFLDNLMHGDLHPGNVFISPDGKKFVLFDVGIVAEYSDADHSNIVSILAAFIRKQGRKAARLMIDESNNRLRASQSSDHALDEEQYIDKIELLTIQAASKDYFMEHLGTYISYICNAASQHHVMMNPSFISAALAVKVQEGIALALDPSIEIWRVATPIIIESERRRITEEAKRKFGWYRVTGSVLGKKEEDAELDNR